LFMHPWEAAQARKALRTCGDAAQSGEEQ
jgi:hypothetical protein